MLLGVATRQYSLAAWSRSGRRGPRPWHQQECGESPICREDRRAARCLAIDRAGCDQSGGAADRRPSHRRALHRGGARHRHHRGQKHALGLWDGSTENAALCQSLLADLQSRGLRTDRSLLIILDGSKALHKAVTQTFGSAAVIHRCHVHKLRNILEHLPEGQRFMGSRDRRPGLQTGRGRDRAAAAAGSGSTTRGPLSECRGQRPRGPR